MVNVKAVSQERCFRLIKTHGVRILTGIPAAVLGLSISRALYLRELVGIVFRFIFFSGRVTGGETRVSHLDPTARVAAKGGHGGSLASGKAEKSPPTPSS